MKRALAALLFLSLLASAGPGRADSPPARKVKTMVDYKTELSLSDDQVKAIQEALKAFQVTIIEQRKLLVQYEGEYANLVAEKAPLEQIKQKLRQVTDTNFNLRYADVLTSRKVESILTAQQLSRWRQIQAKVRTPSQSKSTAP
jgi:hypothetical protein